MHTVTCFVKAQVAMRYSLAAELLCVVTPAVEDDFEQVGRNIAAQDKPHVGRESLDPAVTPSFMSVSRVSLGQAKKGRREEGRTPT
jgi:hypothetical protein